jgi:hypothetical protein
MVGREQVRAKLAFCSAKALPDGGAGRSFSFQHFAFVHGVCSDSLPANVRSRLLILAGSLV